MSISEFANEFKDSFIEANLVNKNGDVDTKKIIDYYSDTYEGLMKINPKDKDDNNKRLMAIQYQCSRPEKLDEIYTSARTHVVSLMNAKDKTLVPTDTFIGDYSLAGSHLIPLSERTVFASSNAADTPGVKLLKKLSDASGIYPLPDGVSKKQNLGVDIPNAPLILVAIPPVSSAESSECLLISNDFQRWLEKKVAWKALENITALSDIRKRIERKDSTSSKDRIEQSARLNQIATQVKKQIQQVQSFDGSEGLLIDSLAQGLEDWAWVAQEVVEWLNSAVASERAMFAVTNEESDQWKSEIYDQLTITEEIK